MRQYSEVAGERAMKIQEVICERISYQCASAKLIRE